MIDLQLAAYKAEKFAYADPKPMRQLFTRKRIHALKADPMQYDAVVKRMRHDTWRRHESHDKQLKHFLDRERYQQNQTWQAEYDRLATAYQPGLQPYLDDRMASLQEMITGRQVDKLQWRPLA